MTSASVVGLVSESSAIPASSQSEYVLEVVNVRKEFPGVVALDDVQLKVRPGTVHALMGENGAGKSTLLKTLSGLHQH